MGYIYLIINCDAGSDGRIHSRTTENTVELVKNDLKYQNDKF